MNKRIFLQREVCLLAAGILLFALLAWLFLRIGRYNFSYLEQWHTFFYQRDFILRTWAGPGGCVRLMAAFLIQFFGHPLTGAWVTALLLTAMGLLLGNILHRWSGAAVAYPLALFPVVALFLLHFEAWYQYGGTLALLLMLLLLRGHLCFGKFYGKLVFAYASAAALFVMAGPVALLYSCLLVVMTLYERRWRSVCFLPLPLLVYVLAVAGMRMGYAGELRHVLLPCGYYSLRLEPGFIVYLPWVLVAAVFVVAALLARIHLPKVWMKALAAAVLLAGVARFTAWGIEKLVDRKYETFKELDYYVAHQDWDGVIACCRSRSMSNLLYQNCLNLALAERGVLADLLFHEPCHDKRSLYVEGEKNPLAFPLLSDIYLSMGHIALAQRYAFEGNEGMGDFSPRLLKRLVETNLIYGCYGTAAKYMAVLEHTLYYKAWAGEHRRFLWNDAAVEADALLGMKRRCLFPDNRFAATQGLDDDLKQVVMQHPAHKATLQYLGCLYLLSKDMVRFKELMERFYGTPALPEGVLPACFQEGVLVFSRGDRELLERYHIEPSTLARFQAFTKRPRAERQNLWYFLSYVK